MTEVAHEGQAVSQGPASLMRRIKTRTHASHRERLANLAAFLSDLEEHMHLKNDVPFAQFEPR